MNSVNTSSRAVATVLTACAVVLGSGEMSVQSEYPAIFKDRARPWKVVEFGRGPTAYEPSMGEKKNKTFFKVLNNY